MLLIDESGYTAVPGARLTPVCGSLTTSWAFSIQSVALRVVKIDAAMRCLSMLENRPRSDMVVERILQ